MADNSDKKRLSDEELKGVVQKESRLFEDYIHWLESHMPPSFFDEVEPLHVIMVAHNLMGFPLQDYFSQFRLQNCAIVSCLDSPDADIRILKHYNMYGIKNYMTFVSDEPPPFEGCKEKLRVGVIFFTEFHETEKSAKKMLSTEEQSKLFKEVKKQNPELTKDLFYHLIEGINSRFVRSVTHERLTIALDMYLRALVRDRCQYEVRFNKDWESQGKNTPSMQIVLAWRNAPKHRFLYRLAKLVNRHNLTLTRVNATYIDPYKKQNILILSLGLHGADDRPAWEASDIDDFLRELVTLKYFDDQDQIEEVFITPQLVRGNLGNFLRTMVNFCHQALVHADPNLYSLSHIEEGLCRHPELTVKLCELFEEKFHPDNADIQSFNIKSTKFETLVEALDTGNQINDMRRKNILLQGLNFITYTLKTNFYRNNKVGLSYRLDPSYLDALPFDRTEKFPDLPFGIFFVQGMYFIGFHIRFKDLSRGGLRTVFPQKYEQMISERNNVFTECYNLAYTQQKKNKDIPEGGSKAVIFLEPYERLLFEAKIYEKELKLAQIPLDEIASFIDTFKKEQKLQYLYQTQRGFIHSFMSLINCEEDGRLKAKHIVDYYKNPEYIYLGPDENMHNEMIEWIAAFSKSVKYKVGSAFISSKPTYGINHKEFGVTSLGVNVCMEETLLFLGIDPKKEPFTIKISGGPDGDVAGNEIYNLYKYYPKTAKLLALIDVSGTIYDPEGLDLEAMVNLFKQSQSIRHYPPELLHDGGFLLDVFTKKEQSAYSKQTLCWRKEKGELVKEWLSGNDMNHLLRHNVHQVKTDVFVPAGGRPRTLNDQNWTEYLDENKHPSSKAIIEGANLYLTPIARRELELAGTIIIKDSSANKGGVICSSFEVLIGLVLNDDEFVNHKKILMPQILNLIAEKARFEAQLIIRTHAETGAFFTDISEWVSERINTFTYQILDYLETIALSKNHNDPLIQCLLSSCPQFLRENYKERILTNIPEVHKKAMIASYIAARLVYKRGLSWQPTIVDVLPLVIRDPAVFEKNLSSDHQIDLIN
ncbi:MAG: NAD-glutamate dehydrogenase domain-containing protein [Simkaniaceae bacterium]